MLAALAAAFFAGCQKKAETVSGTIEVDEVHVAPRVGGRVEKIFAHEGDSLKAGQVIMQLEASELKARRDYVAAQLAELQKGPRVEEIEAARQEWESQNAQLEFARADAKYTGKRYYTFLNDGAVDAYVMTSLSAGYKFNNVAMLKDLSVQVHVNNLFDKQYMATIGSNGFTNSDPSGSFATLLNGAPRQVFITLNGKI